MDVLVLGPVELRTESGAVLAVGGARRWAVLAVLAVHLNEAVTVESLADQVWAGEPPPTARAALQGHVAALRKLLGEGLHLVSTPGGYRLEGDRARVDSCRFEDRFDEARAVRDDEEAARLLLAAVKSWRGDGLTGPNGEVVCPPLARRLSERRMRAIEAYAERMLRLGRAGQVVPALTMAVRAHALREPLVRLLMLCLHQTGRTAEAVELYEQTREGLADELGAQPGPQLLDALARISVRPEPAAPAAGPALVPRQLPRRTGGFVGREAELAELDRAAAAGPGVLAVVGPAGVGKTALVVRWAHRVAERFPDGQLFADLRGFDEGDPERVDAVVSGFLHALGVSGGQLPTQPGERAAMLRSLLARRRLLVVLDNARDAASVRGLLPSGSGSLAVVTSRSALSELELREGARRVALSPLPAADAVALVAAVAGVDRVAAEPESARRWVELCDHLPLALRISASRLVTRPQWSIAQTVAEIEDERHRLSGLAVPGGVGVRAAIAVTGRLLPPEAARLLALLGVLPVEELDACTAAALLGQSLAEARHALGVLAAMHLLEEPRPGRFRRHSLVGLYARQLLAETADPAVVGAVWRRLTEYCVAATYAGAGPLTPYRQLLEPAAAANAGLPRAIDSPAGAVAWFAGNEPLVRAVVQQALTRGDHDGAYRLAQNAYIFYYLAGPADSWVAVCRDGLAAAMAVRPGAGVAHARSALGVALIGAGRAEQGVSFLERARDMDAQLSDPRDRLVTFMRLGVGYLECGAPPERAAAAFESAGRLADELGDDRTKSVALYHLGRARLAGGQLEQALADADASLALLPGAKDNERVWLVLLRAQVLARLGRAEQALAPAEEATAVLGRLGYTAREPEGHRLLAELLLAGGRAAEARKHLRLAVDQLVRAGSPLAEQARRELAAAEGVRGS
ncbi:BTAD domain-containing putative transcriptional regulator [Kitasatospora sp. NPDC049285]|uniref:AfsR/SARP family transcriptional regulator n=1 Tax=Kitasatospora sp. NPDC049285 TaxID=3157096 RepID=UPI003425E530